MHKGSLPLLLLQQADYLLEHPLKERLSRRECRAPLGVFPVLDWLLSTEDCLGKILYHQCSRPNHALMTAKLGIDIVVIGD